MSDTLDIEELKRLAEAANEKPPHRHTAEPFVAFTMAANPQAVLQLIAENERLQRENGILRFERDTARAQKDWVISVLSRIHSFLSPQDVVLPDGRTFEFNNAAIEHDMLKGLTAAIRAIPEKLAEAASQQQE